MPVVLVGVEAATRARGEAMAAGASDYFRLPEEFPLLVARAAQLVAYRLTVDRLRAEADRDYLTGLANRRRFRKALGQEVERWRRYQIPCSLLMLDIDHMKRVNDAHGHPAGDRVIRLVAERARRTLARQRHGRAARRRGVRAAARGRRATRRGRRRARAHRRRARTLEEVGGGVTVSVGVASCPDNARSERELFGTSDAALYRAKQEGRNRAVLASASGPAVGRAQVDAGLCFRKCSAWARLTSPLIQSRRRRV